MAQRRSRLKGDRRRGQRRSKSKSAQWFGKGIVIASVICGLGIVGASYELGQRRAGYDRLAAFEQERMLRGEAVEQRNLIDELRQQVAMLETDAKIKAEAYRLVETRLGELQGKIQAQSEDLAFYQGIVSVDERQGPRVQDVLLSPGKAEGAVVLRMVLAQALRNGQRVTGKLEVAVAGQRDGEPAVIGLKELAGESDGQLDFSFRYFQNLKSELRVPADFSPENVKITLRPKGGRAKTVEQAFAWEVQSS